MTSRFRIALLTALATFMVVGADTATACISVGISGNPAVAHAGDLVRYSVSRLGKGAHYTISFNGSTLIEGVQQEEEAPVGGTFRMPNLGTETLRLTIGVTFDHSQVDGSRDSVSNFLTYEPTATPPPPPPPAPPPPPPPPPPPIARVKGAIPAPGARPTFPAKVHQETTREAKKPRVQSPARMTQSPARMTPHAVVLMATHAAAPQESHRTVAPARRAAALEHAPTPGSPVLQNRPAPPPQVRVAVPRSAPEEAPQAAGAPANGLLRWLVLAIGIVFVLGVNAANGWLRLRRRRIPPTDAEAASREIEAELQEIIAEEQAKRKLRSRG